MISAIVDTNVFLDFIQVRVFHEEAGRILEAAFARAFKACVVSHQVTTIAYVMERAAPSREDFRATLAELLIHLDILPVNHGHFDVAARSTITDFEDAVLEAVATENGLDYIVTRNIKDFKRSRVTALLPSQFLKLLADSAPDSGSVRESAPSYRTRPRRRTPKARKT